MKYDIIGDIHGYAGPLKQLLIKLGYSNQDGAYKHPDENRQVIFVGDFVDRGPDQKEVIAIVRAMVTRGSALAIMGNHEYNAIAFQTEDPTKPGQYLRPRINKNIHQHLAFLEDYLGEPDELVEILDWFKSLPLWLELDGLRVIHACWDDELVHYLKVEHQGPVMTDELFFRSFDKSSTEFDCIETLLKGKEVDLPDGEVFVDKMGTVRTNIRTRWWDDSVNTYREAYMGPEDARETVTDLVMTDDHLIHYPAEAPPVFLGHYWLNGEPELLAENIACVDYSVAKPEGKLVAYQFETGMPLDNSNFIYVER